MCNITIILLMNILHYKKSRNQSNSTILEIENLKVYFDKNRRTKNTFKIKNHLIKIFFCF